MSTDSLSAMIDRSGGHGSAAAGLPRLSLQRSTEPRPAVPQYARPTLCVVCQGEKLAFVGDERLRYDADHYIVSLVELPLASRVVRASRAEPYLGLALELDLPALAGIAGRMGLRPAPAAAGLRGVVRASLDARLLDALERYVALLDRPSDIPFLAAGIESEVWYRLLDGSAGGALAQLAMDGSLLARIGAATTFLRERYAETASLAALATMTGLSRTSFHGLFRRVTGTTPLQLQKLARMQEARRLLGLSHTTAARAAFDVGYVSPSHFSRDYQKTFGITPAADARRMRVDADRGPDVASRSEEDSTARG